ncbi:MAG: immunoglobulin domain-containing protein [Verrucomicrobia bacterium]|nr:immunoglobulin domain-containing protein [Verrucomicrobiota bacterium]
MAIAAGGDIFLGSYTLALKNDGIVVAWGDSEVLDPLNGMSNVIAIAGGDNYGLAIRSGPPTPVITLNPTDKYQLAGGSVTFTTRGVGVYGVSYQWQTNGVNLAGATNATLTLTNVQTNHVGSYRAVVSCATGSLTSSPASFNLVTAPLIVSQNPPTNPVAVYQKDQTLSVTISSVGQTNGFPISYQWKFNGTNIGDNSSSYSLIINSNTLGDYSVVISSAAGVVTSAVWQITGLTYTGSYIDVGTLAYHLSTNAVGRASGYSGIVADQIVLGNWTNPYPAAYSGTNMVFLTNAIWSTNFWLHGVQGLSATCIGYSNGVQGRYLTTMISPRHYLKAHHTQTPEGMLAFLDTNNVVYWRTFVQQVQVGNEGNDTDVGILDADLPTSVGYLPILPTNYFNYLPTNNSAYVQGIGMNQEMRIFGQPMRFGLSVVAWSSMATAPFGLGTNWNAAIVGGDSSDPERLLVGNQLILASKHYGPTGGPNYPFLFDAINEKMHYLSTNNSVGTDYQLSQFSLTNWPAFQ